MDMAETYEYGILNYGLNQAREYIEEMETTFNTLPDRPELWRKAFYLSNGLYKYKFRAHVIFYIVDMEEAYIVRVLGKSMDFQRHI